jgi:hypothetical protein
VNGPVSYREGQYKRRLSKSIRGRQLKMQADENIFLGKLLPGNPARRIGH